MVLSRALKTPSGRSALGIPVVIVGFALVGLGLANLDATVLLMATLVFFAGLLVMLLMK